MAEGSAQCPGAGLANSARCSRCAMPWSATTMEHRRRFESTIFTPRRTGQGSKSLSTIHRARWSLARLARCGGSRFHSCTSPTSHDFASFGQPGFVKVAWALRVRPSDASDTCQIEIEVRVHATDVPSWRKFRCYFWVIGPFSRYIRRSLLKALARDTVQPSDAGHLADASRRSLAEAGPHSSD